LFSTGVGKEAHPVQNNRTVSPITDPVLESEVG